MPAVFATFLLLSLALAGALAFSAPKTRRWLKWVLLLSLALAWLALGFAVRDIVQRTSATLVASLGGPALLATFLAWLAVRATRPGRG